MAKMHIRKGDKVKVITGKNKGTVSTVLRSVPESSRVVVEKVNVVKKHQRPTQFNQRGGIMEIEAPIHVSNVALVCPHCNETTRVAMTKTEEGKKVRVCKKCKQNID